MESTTYITLNLQQPNIAAIAYAVQNDRMSRYILAQLVDGSQAWTPPSGASAMIRYLKPDGTSGFYDTDEAGSPAIVIDGSTATLTLAEQALTVPGDVVMQLNFYTPAGEKLTTLSWLLRVQKSVLTDDSIISTDYYNVLTEQIAAVLNAAESLTGMTASATGLPTGSAPTVNVTGGSGGNPYNLAFGIPAGATGPQGPQGPPGQDGQGSPGTELPLMDGVAAVGTSARFAHEDHVHPEDTTKATAADHKLKSYTAVAQLTQTSSPTFAQIWAALPADSILLAPAADFQAAELPASSGTVEIYKGATSAVGWIAFHGVDGGADFTQDIESSIPSGTWTDVLTVTRVSASDPGGSWTSRAEKFSDGLLICTGIINFTGAGAVQSVNQPFAVDFSEIPSVSAAINGAGAGDTSPSVGTIIPTTTGITVYLKTNTMMAGYSLMFTATGRWK